MIIENKTILLVDDERHFRDSIRFFLEDCDYRILEAENGQIGTEMILEHKPDLVLMDLYMPGMTGLDVLAWVKDHAIEIPIIIISGAGVIHDVAEALRLGAWDYIFKPIEDLSVLEYAIKNAFERARLIQENRNYQQHLEQEVEKRTQALQEMNSALLQKQQHIERSKREEEVLGQLLKLSLQTRDENEFLSEALRIIVKSLGCMPSFQKNKHPAEGAFFHRFIDSKTMVLADSMQLSEKHHQQCLNKFFGESLFQYYCQPSYQQNGEIDVLQSQYYFWSVAVYLKKEVLALLLFYFPDNYTVEENDHRFMARISNILSMGVAKFDAEKEIQYMAYHDALTGLPNRSMLLSRLEQDLAIARRYGWYGALIFVDLDRFKYLNDSLGHLIGDELLKQVALRLKALMRSEDMIARLGGDEFVILLWSQQNSVNDIIYSAQTIAEKINCSLSKPYCLQQHDYFITASYGITLFPIEEGENSTDLLKHADSAMYRAKAEGGNTSRFYKPEMQRAADKRLSVEKDLRKALHNKEMMLYYQPQILIDEQRIIGCEALLRWYHPVRGYISPEDFIPVAEETGIILEIGEWVLRTAAEQLKQWYEKGLLNGFTQLAVNVSPLQLRQANFVELVKTVLADTNINPSLIKIELTEGTIINNVQDVIHKMEQLKEIEVCFSLDDFGTGYSSLSYLTQLPIDQLKIDRSFVKDITTDQNDVAIIETIIAMGNHLGLDVIAEGVETEQELVLLRNKGCLSYQGYYFSKAVSALDFEKLLLTKLQNSD